VIGVGKIPNDGREMTTKIVVLHSGGLDSTTCLYYAHSLGHQVLSLGIDYGQTLKIEMLFAEQQCAAKKIEREIIQVRWSKPARPIPMDRTIADIRLTPSTAFLPGRNAIFLTLGAAHAAGVEADEVWIGINSVDFSGYPDCTPDFFRAFTDLQRIAAPGGPKFQAPLLMKSKPQIAAMAKSLGIGPADTWSCYRPKVFAGGVEPCGRCDACKLHHYAWKAIAA
jgi:7-cyano-7-deazaguanine synthase